MREKWLDSLLCISVRHHFMKRILQYFKNVYLNVCHVIGIVNINNKNNNIVKYFNRLNIVWYSTPRGTLEDERNVHLGRYACNFPARIKKRVQIMLGICLPF